MKKVLLAAALATAMAGASAQEDASGSTFGNMTTNEIVVGAVAVGVVAAVLVNASDDGDTVTPPGPTPCADGYERDEGGVCVPIDVNQCNEGDSFDGTYCVGTEITVVVSGTTTIEVPVTFTYLPLD